MTKEFTYYIEAGVSGFVIATLSNVILKTPWEFMFLLPFSFISFTVLYFKIYIPEIKPILFYEKKE